MRAKLDRDQDPNKSVVAYTGSSGIVLLVHSSHVSLPQSPIDVILRPRKYLTCMQCNHYRCITAIIMYYAALQVLLHFL